MSVNDSFQNSNLWTILDVPFTSTDTINGLSLKYGCPVSSLKRLNKLQKDQDLYALPSIKVPVVKHGTVHELIQNNLSKTASQKKLSTSLITESPLPDIENVPTSVVNKYLQEVDEKIALLTEHEKCHDLNIQTDTFITTIERKPSHSKTAFVVFVIICIAVIIPVTIILIMLYYS